LEDYLGKPLASQRRAQTHPAPVRKTCCPLCPGEAFVTVQVLRYRVAPALVFAVLMVNRLVLVMEQASLTSHLLSLLSTNLQVFFLGSDLGTDSFRALPEDEMGRTW